MLRVGSRLSMAFRALAARQAPLGRVTADKEDPSHSLLSTARLSACGCPVAQACPHLGLLA
jgi:hypothetical protein